MDMVLGVRECLVGFDGLLSSPFRDFVWDRPVVHTTEFDPDPKGSHRAGLHAIRVDRLWFDVSKLAPSWQGRVLMLVQPVPGSRLVLGDISYRAETLQVLEIVCHQADYGVVRRFWSRWVPVRMCGQARYRLGNMELSSDSGSFCTIPGYGLKWRSRNAHVYAIAGGVTITTLEPRFKIVMTFRGSGIWCAEYQTDRRYFQKFHMSPSTLLSAVRYAKRCASVISRGGTPQPMPILRANPTFDQSRLGAWIRRCI